MKKLFSVIALAMGMVMLMSSGAAAEKPADKGKPDKVFVCKYVGKPGVDERLKAGKNPISVAMSATDGTWFNDAQGRSYVVGQDTGGPAPSVSSCPVPVPDNPEVPDIDIGTPDSVERPPTAQSPPVVVSPPTEQTAAPTQPVSTAGPATPVPVEEGELAYTGPSGMLIGTAMVGLGILFSGLALRRRFAQNI